MRRLNQKQYYALFISPLGPCGVLWSEKGLTRLQLPESSCNATEQRLLNEVGSAILCEPPEWVRDAIRRVQNCLKGRDEDLSSILVDLDACPPFRQRVYEATRSISWGQTASYSEVARRAGFSGAARAVGQALAHNPIALIIPCHRVLASGNRLGGFSAHGGVATKAKLLAIEGVNLVGQQRNAS